MTTEAQILEILRKLTEVCVHDPVGMTGSSRQMLHRAVKNLVDKGVLEKIGSPPTTYYRLKQEASLEPVNINSEDTAFLNEHFLLVTETGKRLIGAEAMAHWCYKQKLPFEKTIREFIATRKKYLTYFLPNGLISGLQKIKSTKGLHHIGLDQVYYLDFYAIERFGKTRLGALLHLAKQGQNRKLMDEILDLSHERIEQLGEP